MQKIDLKDVTFLIPIRIDSSQRLENILAVLRFLHSYFHTSVFVLEADVREQVRVPDSIRKWFVKDHDPVFHRTHYLKR
ncbi:MAG: hypothetical protein AB2L20_22355 [Mangrovibacterium sp.]